MIGRGGPFPQAVLPGEILRGQQGISPIDAHLPCVSNSRPRSNAVAQEQLCGCRGRRDSETHTRSAQ